MRYHELHCHTFYSPLDGLSSPEEYCARAKEIGIDALAITDHGTLAGHRHFQRATTEAGIKPILGLEAYISETDRFDRRSKNKRDEGDSVYNHIILLAKNNQGVEELNTLSRIAWTEGFYQKPRCDFDSLSEHGNNLIVLSGCMSGLISRNILNDRPDQAVEWTRRLKERFGDDFYMELQTHNPPELNHELLRLADEHNIKPLITGDCHYADPSDKWAEEAFLILGTKPKPAKDIDMSKAAKMDLIDRFDYLYPNRGMRFADIDVFLEKATQRYDDMVAMGIDRPELFENTNDVVDKVDFYEYKKDLVTLPVREDKNPPEMLRKICEQGLRRRALAHKPEYVERMNEELDVIINKDLAVYFVILWDALRFCRQEGIVYGAGRGSAAGSLVCYLAEITEVDPIEFNLLFWRFLDPSRSDTADIDVDIQDNRRSDVKRYLEEKYGNTHVASVTTYGTYKGKSAIKAACRVLNIPYGISNWVSSKMVSQDSDENLDEYRNHPELKSFRDENPDVLRIAEKISGRISSYGMHAGGVIVSNNPLESYVGVETRSVPGEDFRQLVIAVNKDDAEEIGLIKFDFLGLKTLSTVSDAVKMIRENHGVVIDYKRMKEDDHGVFRMLSRGETVGVFQAEAAASTSVIVDLQVDNFDQLVASNALVRPGAMNAFGKDYVATKLGKKKPKYPTEDSQWFLEDTLSFPLYQEQTMLLCTEIAGLTQAEASQIRRVTSKKKDKATLQPFMEKFISGASKKVSPAQAAKLWGMIETTAEYSFNKCLVGNTMVNVRLEKDGIVEEKTISLEELSESFSSYDTVSVSGPEFVKDLTVGPIVYHPVKAIHDNGEQPIVRIYTSSDHYIDSTYLHRHRLSKRWKHAMWIHQGDVIFTDQGKQKVWGRKYMGVEQTYDLELYSDPHAFYANGFLTHNSHAVAYSKLTYTTAWLKLNYPAEFMAALLNNEKEENKVSDYISECTRLGLEIKTPNVNKSNIGYTTSEGVIYMGLDSVKFISSVIAERIINLRPFDSYESFMQMCSAKGSGINSRAVSVLKSIGALDFPDNRVDWTEAKKSHFEYLGILSFDDGQITPKMKSNITDLIDYEEKSTAIFVGVVQDIVSKNNWIRADITDGSGKTGLFVEPDHSLEKKKRYLFLVSGGKIIDLLDLSSFRKDNIMVRYLNGEFAEGVYMIGRKSRKTAKGNLMGTIVLSYNGELNAVTCFSDAIGMVARIGLGEQVDLAIEESKSFGLVLKGMRKHVE